MLLYLPLLTLCGFATAATQTTLKVNFVGFGNQTGIEASIVDVDAVATTFMLNCPPDAPEDNECGMPHNLLFTYASTTLEYTFSTAMEKSLTITNTVHCHLDSVKDNADCIGVEDQTISGKSKKTTMNIVQNGYMSTPLYITVTAGAAKLNSGKETATPGASATDMTATDASAANSAQSTISKATGASETATETATSPSSSAQSGSSSSGNAAGPAVTQHVMVVGVAAVVGGAAMML